MVLVFWVLFCATVASLLATAWAGFRAKRRVHFSLAALTLVLLFATIKMTRVLVENVTFREGDLPFHLRFAITATCLLVPVLVSGIGYAWKGGVRWRLFHRISVVVFVLAVLTATGTGVWAFARAS